MSYTRSRPSCIFPIPFSVLVKSLGAEQISGETTAEEMEQEINEEPFCAKL